MIDVPGKVLFYGGFSVLEMGHPALSLAAIGPEGGLKAKAKKSEKGRIRSPQFGLDFEPSSARQELVNFPYLAAEAFLRSKNLFKAHADITLHNGPMFGAPGEKTGLGSSAAACVAVVRAVFEAQGLDTPAHAETIHRLAQFAYACFSKKVGSGFDIATCAAGHSIVYERYGPKAIVLPESMDAQKLQAAVSSSLASDWKGLKREQFGLPKEYALIFFNIQSSKTSTISSVKAVGEYKKKEPQKYAQLIESQKEAEIRAISALVASNDDAVRAHTHEARQAHRELQVEVEHILPASSFDPIEPKPLQNLIEAAEKLDGVVAGRCPGAGGWDGVAFIIRTDFEGEDAIVKEGRRLGLSLASIPLRVL
ncbi:MAG: hypothetical protein M1530_00065 [Candidatus Marsarchaeota archaeon]|nr:hypothetical protein [Candidatus Marsarchaeota archaeon]